MPVWWVCGLCGGCFVCVVGVWPMCGECVACLCGACVGMWPARVSGCVAERVGVFVSCVSCLES